MKPLVIFLDIDGVLVPFGPEYVQTRTFHPPCVSILKQILALHPNPKIVFSTTWRLEPYIQVLYEQWLENDLPANICIGATPDLRHAPDRDINQLRGQEIQRWVIENSPSAQYLVIDDDHLSIHPSIDQNRCLFTDPSQGLTEESLQLAVNLLR